MIDFRRIFISAKILLPFCLISVLTTTAQTSVPSVVIENGVSKKLADRRKQQLSDVQYTLHLHIPTHKEEPIASTEQIAFNLLTNSDALPIDFKEKKDHIQSIRANGKTVPVLLQKEHLLIPQQYLVKGRNRIDINFTAGDFSLNRNDDFMYTLLVPDRARTVFPCFDQPNLKATFTLSLTLPREWTALSNAPFHDSLIDGKNKTYHFATSDTISTYLFSFAAGKFERVTKTVNGTTMRFYHRETDSSKLALSTDSVFRLHTDALSFLEEYTSIPYPFQKLDFVAIPDFQYGGMEHVGAIQYKASSLFLDSGATKDERNSRANLISHETAHMWFGDMVTMRWFNDVWMKEVFANFMADKITQGNQPHAIYELKFLIDHFPAAYAVDRTAGANSIRQPLANLQEAGTLYGNIIYHKAPIMMRQLERLMGIEEFRDGLRQYVSRYKFGNATWPDLISILDKLTPSDLQAWNKVWVNETGRPQFSYSLKQNGNTISQLHHQPGEQTGGNICCHSCLK